MDKRIRRILHGAAVGANRVSPFDQKITCYFCHQPGEDPSGGDVAHDRDCVTALAREVLAELQKKLDKRLFINDQHDPAHIAYRVVRGPDTLIGYDADGDEVFALRGAHFQNFKCKVLDSQGNEVEIGRDYTSESWYRAISDEQGSQPGGGA